MCPPLTVITYTKKQSTKIDGLPSRIFSAICYGLQMQIETAQWLVFYQEINTNDPQNTYLLLGLGFERIRDTLL